MKYFAGQRFDEDRHTLSLGTKEVRLTRKAAAVLECLIERAGRTVTRDEILSTVWSGTHVHADNPFRMHSICRRTFLHGWDSGRMTSLRT